jgi:DNA topoisomerase I
MNSTTTDVNRASARLAHLRYVNPNEPGIRREKKGRGFAYRKEQGGKIADGHVIDRIRKLGIPPAWQDVWICVDERGHIQAMGRDARGRKQYRYHSDWAKTRSNAKYDHLLTFARALPQIRARVNDDLGLRGLPRRKVVAAAVRLLDEAHIRVGNEEYTRANGSFGLTTLRDRHVTFSGPKVAIHFRGKAGKVQHVELTDRRLSNVMRRCHELPGQVLFQYVDDAGALHCISSGDVNDYLREVGKTEITAKDFRTWAATLEALRGLSHEPPRSLKRDRKRDLMAALESAAALLGNTVTVCRKSYIHPMIVTRYLEGTLKVALPRKSRRATGMTDAELGLLTLLMAMHAEKPRRSNKSLERER